MTSTTWTKTSLATLLGAVALGATTASGSAMDRGTSSSGTTTSSSSSSGSGSSGTTTSPTATTASSEGSGSTAATLVESGVASAPNWASNSLYSYPHNVGTVASSLLSNAVKAMGGEDTLKNLTTSTLTMTQVNTVGVMRLTIIARSDGTVHFEQSFNPVVARTLVNKLVVDTSAPGATSGATADDGSSTLKQPMPDTAYQCIKRAGDLWNPVLIACGQFDTIQWVGTRTYGGKTCNVLALSRPKIPGIDSGNLYLDASTGLPVGEETFGTRETAINSSTTIDTWQTLNGYTVPRSMTVTAMDGTSTLTLDSLTLTQDSSGKGG